MDYPSLQANNSTMNTSSNVTLQNYNEFNNSNYHQNTSYQYYNANNNNSMNNTGSNANTSYNNNYYETANNKSGYYPNNSNIYNNDYYNSYATTAAAKSTTNEYEQAYNDYKFSNSTNYYDWPTSSNNNNNDTSPVTKSSPNNQQTDIKYYNDINMLNNLNGQQSSCYGSYNLNQQYDDYNYEVPLVTTAATAPSNLVSNKNLINDNSCEIINATNDYSNWDYNNTKTNNTSNSSSQIYPPILGESTNKQQAVLPSDNTNFNELTTYNYNYPVENTVKTPASYNYDHSISPLNDNNNNNNNTNGLSYQYGYNNLQPSTSSSIDKKYSNSSHKKTLILSKNEDNGFHTSTPKYENSICKICGKNSINFNTTTGTCELCVGYLKSTNKTTTSKDIKKEKNLLNYPITINHHNQDSSSFLSNYQTTKSHKKDFKKLKIKSNKQKIKIKKSLKIKKHSSSSCLLNYSYFNNPKPPVEAKKSTVDYNDSLKFGYKKYIENEINNAELIKSKQTIIINNIKNIINDKRNSIKSLFITHNLVDTIVVNKEDLNLRYENFKTILQNYLFNLAKLLVKCIIDTVNDKYDCHEVNNNNNNNNNSEENVDELSYEIMNLINSTNNKSLIFAYMYLVENIDENLVIIPENDYEKQFKNFKKSLKRIYSSICNDDDKMKIENLNYGFNNNNNSKNDQQQQQFATNSTGFMSFYDEQINTTDDKEFYYSNHQSNYLTSSSSQEANDNIKISCSLNELKILNFIFLLFSKFINTDFDLSLFNCSLKNVSYSKTTESSALRSNETNNNLVRIACVKIVSRLIDQLCVDKTIKTKILLNASDLI